MKLSDIAIEIKEPFDPKKNTEELCYIGLEHISPKTLHIDSHSYSSDVESLKYRFAENDILFGTMRPYFKKIIRAPFGGVCSTEIAVIRAKNKPDMDYIFYLMAQDSFIEFTTVNSSGDRPRTKWRKFSKFPINHNSEEIRFRIGKILSYYDDLIDTNRRRIQLLEESARLLFRDWFVYFRFPGHEKVKIVDGVPEGWEKGPIKKYYDTTSGGTPRREHPEYYQGDINWVKTQELDEKYIFETEEKVTQEAISKSSAKIFPANTLLVSIYGNANIGRTGILAKPAASNQACVAFFPIKPYFHFIYLQQYLQMIRDYLVGMSQGAAQTNISQDTLRKVNILMPDEIFINKFLKIAEPMYEQIKNLQYQNQKLAQARDLLLPRLMSGEIEV